MKVYKVTKVETYYVAGENKAEAEMQVTHFNNAPKSVEYVTDEVNN